MALAAGLIAVLALYRAGSFIHELTHIRNGDVKLMIVAVVIAGVISLIGDAVYAETGALSRTPGAGGAP